MPGLGKSAALITALTATGLAFGFLANMAVASAFGVGADMDVYLAATTLPSLLTLILTTSVGAVFLPVFSESRERDPREAHEAAAAFLTLVAVGSLALCAACMAFAHPLARLLAPGLPAAQIEAAAALMRWLLPVAALAAVNQILAALHHARGAFLLPSLGRVTGPLLLLASVLLLAKPLGVRSMVLATLATQLLQTALLCAGLFGGMKTTSLTRASLNWRHPAVRRLFALMTPMMLGMFLYKLGPAFERWLASGMAPGSLSVLGYAKRLNEVLQPMLVSGISIAGFALASRHVARGEPEGVRAVMEKSLGGVIFTGVPLGIFLCGFAKPVVALVYERGAFTTADTQATWPLFALYALALPMTAAGTLIGQAFYAHKDTRTPTFAGIADVLLFALFCFWLRPTLGLAAFPVAFLAAYGITSGALVFRLTRRAGFSAPRLIARPLFRATGAALAGLAAGRALLLMTGQGPVWTVTGLALAAAVYLWIQGAVFRSPEAAMLAQILTRRRA